MNKSIAVFGIGRFGKSVALSLMDQGVDVLAVDMDEEIIAQVANQVTCAVAADVSDVSAMSSLGVGNMDKVVVAMAQDLEASIMGVLTAKELGVSYVLAKAKDKRMGDILTRIGADEIVYPEEETGIRVARKLVSNNFLEFFEISDNLYLLEMLPKESWIGHNLKQLNLRKKYNLNVIAIKDKDTLSANIDPDKPLDKDTPILITIDKKDLKKLS